MRAPKSRLLKLGAITGVIATILGLCVACGTTNNCNSNNGSSADCNINIGGGGSSNTTMTESATGQSTVPSEAAPVQSSDGPSSRPAEPQYSPVLLSVFCSDQNVQNGFIDCEQDGYTAEIGQHVYDFSAVMPTDVNASQALSFASRSTCRSISLRFTMAEPTYDPSALRITVSVVQSQMQSKSVTVAPNQLGTLSTPIGAGPWHVDTAANLSIGGGYNLLMDGSASCSTSTGQ